jgi:uncharacterized metal-binding protein
MAESNDPTGGGRKVLLFACSGAANVAEAADKACRQLMYEGCASMFCLAGLGAGDDGMVQAAREADVNVVVDGCDTDCGKRIFDRAGIGNYVQIKVTDLDVVKHKGIPATEEQVAVVVHRIRRELD